MFLEALDTDTHQVCGTSKNDLKLKTQILILPNLNKA